MVVTTDHDQYRATLLERLRTRCADVETAKRFWAMQGPALALWTANLDAVCPILARLYTGIGRPPRDPAAMFRTWLLATQLGISSPKGWADRLRTDGLAAALSGFAPDDTPGATTLADFLRRLTRQMRRRTRRRRPHRKRGKGPGKGNKQPLRRPDLLWRLQVQLPRFSRGDEGPLQEILAAIAHASADHGLIDLRTLSVAGDSTVMAAHADHFGHRTCSCPRDVPCVHRRRFSDPDASWGWDSSRGIWVYGHRFYEITAAGGRHDLPLYIRAVGADRHDGISWMLSYTDFRSYYADAHLIRAILDSAHDAGAIFDQLQRDGLQAVIDLNPAHNPKEPVRFTPTGIPVCACGAPMAPDGSSRGRPKFVCPNKRKRRALGDQPPCPRAVYISGAVAFRAHPGLARGTDAWRLAYNARTCTERSHTRKRNDFGQLSCRRRGRPSRTAHYFLAGYAQHFAAWAAEAGLRAEAVFHAVLGAHLAVLIKLPRDAAA